MPLDLTIAIPTRNEEKNLPACLQAIGSGFAKKIIVLDSHSTDSTCAIAARYGADIIQFEWSGKFPKKRNWFLQNHQIATAWVLFLDADEFLTEPFKEELRRVLPSSSHAGYWLHYSVYFLGRKLKGGYPLDKLALFRFGAGEYEHIEESDWSSLDMEVHEHPVLNGTIGSIGARIDHRDFRGTAHWVAKHNEYSSWEAARFLRYGGDAETRSRWTWKQKIKYRFMRTPLLGIAYFVGSFIFMGGWRDGFVGLSFAILKMSYFTQISAKLREANPG